MNPIRNLSRPTLRRLNRPWSRSRARSCLRRVIPRRRGPDELSQALTAFGRALRCHRRLAKLAPQFFDTAVVEEAGRHRAERRQWMALWLPALNRAYGLDPDTPDTDPEDTLPPLPSRAVQHQVDQLLVELPDWLAAGGQALALYRQRQPHAFPSFNQLARLLNLATQLGRFACGVDPTRPPASPPNYDQVWADLARAYPSEPSSPHPLGRAAGGADLSAPRTAAPENAPPFLPPRPVPPSLPPDDKRDLIPHYLVTGPHGLLCLQPIVVSPKF